MLLVPYVPTVPPSPYTAISLPQFRVRFINGALTVDKSPVSLSATTTIGRTNNRTDGTAAGRGDLTFDDTTRDLDPDYASSPLYGKITPGNATTVVLDCGVPTIGYYPLYTGLIEDDETTWPMGPTYSEAAISLVDAQRDLTTHIPAYNSTFPAQQTGARIGSLLGAPSRSGWGWINRAPSNRFNLDVGQKVLGPLTCDGTTDTWSYVADAASAEEGLAFFDQGGVPTFQDQLHRVRQTTPVWVFGEASGELRYEGDITMSLPNDRIVADVAYQTVDGITSGYGPGGAFSWDSSSTAPGGAPTGDQIQLADSYAGASRAYSDYRRFSVNRRDIPSITINAFADWATVSSALASNRAWCAVTAQIGDLVTVNRRPGIGSTISKSYYIDAISHTINPGEWTTKFYLVSIDLSVPGWKLGVDKLGSIHLSW
jgi:hypothetical protein